MNARQKKSRRVKPQAFYPCPPPSASDKDDQNGDDDDSSEDDDPFGYIDTLVSKPWTKILARGCFCFTMLRLKYWFMQCCMRMSNINTCFLVGPLTNLYAQIRARYEFIVSTTKKRLCSLHISIEF